MPDYDKQHLARLNYYARRVAKLFSTACEEAARLGASLPAPDDDVIFSFDDYPQTRASAYSIIYKAFGGTYAVVVDGINGEWELANKKNDALCDSVLEEQMRKAVYYRRNDDAREAFLNRKESGLNLSQRVWRYSGDFKTELELGIDCGLRDGLDAPAMARRLKQYLQNPDKLFRRVRDEHGNLQLSKAAQAYHPGRGVYRSSYKNARRLAVTETNIAYNTADYERWQHLDFILGIEVRLSNNHTSLGSNGNAHPIIDICDELQGTYPKEFKFTGWHPHCRCIAVPLLPSPDDFMAQQAAMISGEQDQWQAEGAVTEMPENFTQWVEDNRERIERSVSTPYFIRDNFVDGDPDNGYVWSAPSGSEQGIDNLIAETKELTQDEKDEQTYGAKFVEHIHELESYFGKERGERMSVEEADEQHANPNYVPASPTSVNCQTCAPAYVLRTRGFDVYAKGCYPDSDVQNWIAGRSRSFAVWSNVDGSDAVPTRYRDWLDSHGFKSMSSKRYRQFFEENTKDEGIYIVTIGWKGGGGHATILQRFADGSLGYIEPQVYSSSKGAVRDISELCDAGTPKIPRFNQRGIMRVDDKMLKHYCTTQTGESYDIWSIFWVN